MPQFGAEYFKLSPEMLCILNMRGEFYDLNPSWEKNLGRPIDGLRFTSFFDLLHPDDIKDFTDEFNKLLEFNGHVMNGHEVRCLHIDGGYRWLQWSASPIIEDEKKIFCVVRDITQAKRESLLLIETQEVSRVGSWEIDLTTKELFWSKMAHQIHETDYENYKPKLGDGLSFFSEDTHKKMKVFVERLLQFGEGYDQEFPFITAKGRKTWVRCVARATMRDGVVIRAFGTIEDISQKLLEKNRNELIVKNGNFGTWDWDLETDAVIFNERFCSIVGLDVKTVKHELATWEQYAHPIDKIQTYKDIADHLAGKTAFYSNVHRMKHQEGHWVWILDQGKVVEFRDGRPVRFSGTHTDITYLKELEEERIRLNDRFKLVLEAIKFGVWDWDMVANKLVWDDIMFEIFGVARSDFTGEYNAWINCVVEEDLERSTAALHASIEDENIDFDTEFRIKLSDGSIRHVGAKGYVHRDIDGKPIRVTGINWDITNRVDQENLIKDQQARMISSAKLSSLGEMASGIAHEINNPLAIIKGKAYHILKKLESGEANVDFLIKEITKIEQNSLRIVKIIKGLRTFSRHGEGDPFQLVIFKSVLDDVLELCYERFKYQGVLLKTSGDLDSEILCQETQMAQVLLNLVNNAYDAVSVQQAPWVEISVENMGDTLNISITDSGNGIRHDIADKIMQPFFTTKEVGVGTGLGLSISKGIIEMHNGRFYLDKNCSNTRFVIELPSKK